MSESAPVSVPPLLGPGLCVRRLNVRASEVVLVRGILEASEGLATLFAEHGGELFLAAPTCQAAALDELVDDLVRARRERAVGNRATVRLARLRLGVGARPRARPGAA